MSDKIHPLKLNFEEWFYAFTMMAYKSDLRVPTSEEKDYYREMFFDIGYSPEDAIYSEEAAFRASMEDRG